MTLPQVMFYPFYLWRVFFFLSLCVTWRFISDERGRVQAQRNYLG